MFAICFFGYGIGKKLQTPSGENGEYTYVIEFHWLNMNENIEI